MKAVMERWVRTCRRELLDRTLIVNQLQFSAGTAPAQRRAVRAARA
jgi:hypothetical protein